MKLWYSTTSPFARKALAVIKHHQLDDKVEMLRVTKAMVQIRHIIKITR